MASVEMRRIYLCEVKFLDVPLAVFDLDRERCIREDADGALFIETENDRSGEVQDAIERLGVVTWMDIWPAAVHLGDQVSKLTR